MTGARAGPQYTAEMRKPALLFLLSLPAHTQEHVDLGLVDA